MRPTLLIAPILAICAYAVATKDTLDADAVDPGSYDCSQSHCKLPFEFEHALGSNDVDPAELSRYRDCRESEGGNAMRYLMKMIAAL
jgi:hypothetical protein